MNSQSPNVRRILIILFLANLLNIFDRALPAILMEPIRHEWTLNDFQLALIASAFTLVLAVSGIPLGRLADVSSRVRLMGNGMLFWSAFSGLSGLAWTGIYMLGIPLGLLLSFATGGAIAQYFGSWRAPFLLSFVPGVILAYFIFSLRDSIPGAPKKEQLTIARPFKTILSVPTFWFLTIANIACAFAIFSTNAFMVPLLQRHFGASLQQAGMYTGLIVGGTGLIGLTLGGWFADYLQTSHRKGRVFMAAFSFAGAGCLTAIALFMNTMSVQLFVALFAIGWLLQYSLYVCLYPAVHDVVPAELRATSMSVFISAPILIGGTLGPLAVGLMSDHFALKAQMAAGASTMEEAFRATGLHTAMGIIPVALLCASGAAFIACWKFVRDSDMAAAISGQGIAPHPAHLAQH